MSIVGAKIAKICETRKGRERSFRNLGIGGCRCALPLIVFREFKEVREVREGSCVMRATLAKFL